MPDRNHGLDLHERRDRLLDVGTGTGTVARLSASYLDGDGRIAVPTEALLAAGIRD